jgi:peptide/nickel transport system permease protein
MLAFIVRRIMIAIPSVITISVFVFLLRSLLPDDPVLATAGEEHDPQVMEFLRDKYRLNDSLYKHYITWSGNVLCEHLWATLRTNMPVTELIAQKLPVTLQLIVSQRLV